MPEFLRLLVLGPPKIGKTETLISTAPEGGIYVLNSDQLGATDTARSPSGDRVKREFTEGFCEHPQTFETRLKEIRDGVKAGTYQTVIWDTVTEYGRKAKYLFEDASENDKGEADGRRFWPKFTDNLMRALDRLLALKAHLIVIAHSDNDPEEGLALNLAGKQARQQIPALFHDVLALEKRGDARILSVKKGGVLGSRTLKVKELPADVAAMWAAIQKGGQ